MDQRSSHCDADHVQKKFARHRQLKGKPNRKHDGQRRSSAVQWYRLKEDVGQRRVDMEDDGRCGDRMMSRAEW